MTKRTRSFIFSLFVILFFVLAPLAIFYAAGYKINFSWPIKINSFFQKTGMLVLDTEPKNATVYLNGTAVKNLWEKILFRGEKAVITPAKIKGLLPGEYEIRLEMDGYWPWEKKITIYPGTASVQENIWLFKKDLPLQVVEMPLADDGKGNFLSIAPDGNSLAGYSQENLKIFNTAGGKITTWAMDIDSISEKNISWSPDSAKLLAGKKIFTIAGETEPDDLEKIINPNISNIKWASPDADKIYYQYQNGLNLFSLGQKKSQLLLTASGIQDYLIKEEEIIFVANEGGTAFLKSYSPAEKKIMHSAALPFSSEYKILSANEKYIHLYDAKYKILYLLNFSSLNPLKESVSNVERFVWADENRLLYASSHEIWLLELAPDSLFEGSNKKTLLARLSQPITNIAWHPDGRHIFYATASAINAMSLDTKEERILTELIKLDDIRDVIFLPKKNLAFFCARIGNQEGVYKLEL